MTIDPRLKYPVFVVALAACLTPIIDPPKALLLGFLIALTTGNPFIKRNSEMTGVLLKASVVGLGFGMNVFSAMEVGRDGIVFTIVTIGLTFLIGLMVRKWLNVDSKTSYLICSGTAICGGSAIAAVSPIVKADKDQMSVALGTVFILNSVALMIFPEIGRLLNLTQHQFGLWSAIAIHDTSSVVGASAEFGEEALKVATTTKLGRALWIIPLSVATVFVSKSESRKVKIPYFIGLYVIAMCIRTYLPQLSNLFEMIVAVSKKGLTVTLFLIGSGLSIRVVKEVGIRPLLQGILLWVSISVISFGLISLA